MTFLADTHVHLLAGLDDGPRTIDEALAMCRMLSEEGVRYAAALAHQNESYPDNTADRLRTATNELSLRLKEEAIPLSVYPTGEIILTPDLVEEWQAGKLLSIGDHGRFLLVEMPHSMFVDVLPLAKRFREIGIRLVIAHAERYPELLHERGLVERWIMAGCLIQISAGAVAASASAKDERILKDWAKRGIIHLLGTDGHRIGRREPRMRTGYQKLVKWVGQQAADRIGSIRGAAILQGLSVNISPLELPTKNGHGVKGYWAWAAS